ARSIAFSRISVPLISAARPDRAAICFPFGWLRSFRVSRALLEGDVVVENCPRIYRHLPGFLDVELDKRDLVSPDRPQELLDELDRQMLTGAAAVAEAERRIAGRVDHRVGNAVDLAIDGAECRVGHFYIATVFDRKGFLGERTPCQTDFPDPGLIVGRTGW